MFIPVRKAQKNYKERSSNFREWEQKDHAETYLLFPENIGKYLSIDELSLSRGELYTFVTNKLGKCKQGSLVAVIKGTLSKDIIEVLMKLPQESRDIVEEVTMDMANNMETSIRNSFPKARIVTDRFHVIKLVTDALQHIRIKHRWEELDKENEAISQAKKEGTKYKIKLLPNGDSVKQLLARSRLILYKKPNEFTERQSERIKLLFELFPNLQKAYEHVLEFRNIFETKCRHRAAQLINNWIIKTKEFEIKEFNTVSNTLNNNLENILNFFINRNTNAYAESFNAKIKLFRANLRGVVDTKFFLFRIAKLFA